ncbi:MAG: hypothetical protein IPN77_05105 [Sandaracinaceae bacterium]|nr:hypothetical protein [Sandaracinaceae bacterium]
MTDLPPLPPDSRTAPAQPARAASRPRRALAVLAVDVLGCSVHALLFALASAGWFALLEPLAPPGWSLTLLTSASVVLALSAVWPGLPWWGLALATATRDGRRLPAREVTVRLGQLLSGDRRARYEALRAALALHAMFAAPTLGVVLALELGGLVWAALVLLVLLSPSLTLAVGRQVMRRYPRAALTNPEQLAEPPLNAVRVLAGLALTTTSLALSAALMVAVPAPTQLAGTCEADAWGTPASIPGALPETELFIEANASDVTLSASDGGGPGSIPLATCSVLGCRVVPARAMVEDHDQAQVVTLCPAVDHTEDAPAQQVVLARGGYRLDDGVARRVLRSDASVALALALVLLGFAYAPWGFRALLRWAAPAGAAGTVATPSPRARTAVLWALALGGTQFAWLLVTWLGP